MKYYDDRIAVVIVNYSTPHLVIEGLAALAEERKIFSEIKVVVVDNFSPDDSIVILKQAIVEHHWLDWVKLIYAPKNGGFAYGNNLGFYEAMKWMNKVDYFWLLNPDTKVLPGATEALISFLKDNPNAIAGSRLQDQDGTVQVSTFNYPSIIGELCSGFRLGLLDKLFVSKITCRPIPSQKEATDWLAGASIMFSESTHLSLGNMDEEYFLYYEEVDYFLKANRKGIQCWYIPESKVIHQVGASTGISDVRKKQPRRPQYWFESRRHYFKKNYNGLYLSLADIAWLFGYSIWSLRKWLSGSKELAAEPPMLMRDFFLQSQLVPSNWWK